MSKRDVVITFYSCPSKVPEEKLKCAAMVAEFWQGREADAPVVLEAQVGLDAASFVKKSVGVVAVDGKPVQSWLKPFLGQNAPNLKGAEPGRIALIGFSQGCNGVKEVLNIVFDAAQIDFVYACDGAAGAMHPDSSKANFTTEVAGIIIESIEAWVRFGVMAAKSAQGKGTPADRCMVITHSEIAGRAGSASTQATAERIRLEVAKRVGSAEAPACIVPMGLLGAAEDQLDPGPWKSSWNSCGPNPNNNGAPTPGYPCASGAFCPCPANVQPPWPVSNNSVSGNLIIVGFAAITDNEAKCGKACSEPAHIFQNHWVHRQVWKEILTPRWEKVCTHEKAGGGQQATIEAGGGQSAAGFGLAIRRYSPVRRRGKLTLIRPAPRGLGQDTFEVCGIEGVISQMFAPGEIAALLDQRKALVAGGLVAGFASAMGIYLWATRK